MNNNRSCNEVIHARMRAHTNTHTHARTHTHAHTHARAHTRTHTHTYGSTPQRNIQVVLNVINAKFRCINIKNKSCYKEVDLKIKLHHIDPSVCVLLLAKLLRGL